MPVAAISATTHGHPGRRVALLSSSIPSPGWRCRRPDPPDWAPGVPGDPPSRRVVCPVGTLAPEALVVDRSPVCEVEQLGERAPVGSGAAMQVEVFGDLF